MAPYKVLYGRRCRTPVCWEEMGKRKLYRLELVQVDDKNIKVIRKDLKVARNRQKSYADHVARHRNLKLEIRFL